MLNILYEQIFSVKLFCSDIKVDNYVLNVDANKPVVRMIDFGIDWCSDTKLPDMFTKIPSLQKLSPIVKTKVFYCLCAMQLFMTIIHIHPPEDIKAFSLEPFYRDNIFKFFLVPPPPQGSSHKSQAPGLSHKSQVPRLSHKSQAPRLSHKSQAPLGGEPRLSHKSQAPGPINSPEGHKSQEVPKGSGLPPSLPPPLVLLKEFGSETLKRPRRKYRRSKKSGILGKKFLPARGFFREILLDILNYGEDQSIIIAHYIKKYKEQTPEDIVKYVFEQIEKYYSVSSAK